MATFSDLVAEAREKAHAEATMAGLAADAVPLAEGGKGAQAYADAVALYTSIAVDRLIEKCNILTSWQSSAQFLRGAFARQALPMIWDYADANPFSDSTGNFGDAVEWVAEVLSALRPASRGEVSSADAARLDASSAYTISTDPPYYDNIGYADLSDFFYVWLRHSLKNIFPSLFATLLVPKSDELVVAPHRFGGSRANAQVFFEKGLGQAIHAMRSAQASDYPFTLYYAFKQTESEDGEEIQGSVVASTGWESMLTGVVDAGFAIVGTWPMRSERGGRMRDVGSNALASSIVLVCRPRAGDAASVSRAEFLEELGLAMREALPLLASGRVAPVDLAQASIGPGMGVYSKYAAVVRQDGRRVGVREALQDINAAIAGFRSERVSSFDEATRFCLSWYDQHGFAEGKSGDADTLARAFNVGPNALVRDGLLVQPQGRTRLESPKSFPPGVAGLEQAPFHGSAWEGCLRLATTLDQQGEAATALLIAALGEGVSVRARELAVWLYTIADGKKRADDAFLFNALNASWSGVQEQLARHNAGQQASF